MNNNQKAVPNRKSKAQIKKEKMMNATMHPTSRKTIEAMGIVAVHPEESLFQTKPENGKSAFIKIYSIKGLDNSEMRKEMLIHSLCDCCASRRLRISSFQYAGNNAPIFFLSVYFYGSSYADIYDEVREFDELLETILRQNIRISIKPCSISDIFMFIFMNYNGQIKKISPKAVLRKNADWGKEYLRYVSAKDNGFQLEEVGKYGCCYMAVQYPDAIERIFEKIRQTGCAILSSVDIQKVPDKYLSAYKEYVEQIYNGTVETEKSSLLNTTFLFSVFVNSEKEMKMMDQFIKDHMEKNNLIVTNCTGVEGKVLDSIATMGLFDFHCMRNVEESLIASFLI